MNKYTFGQNILAVQHAIYEKEIFFGYYMLCRYLSGRGYKRYGCNAGYDKSIGTHGKDRLYPCKILCKDGRFYYQKIRSYVIKLVKMGYVYTKKVELLDSINEDLPVYRTKLRKDVFVLIASTKEIIDNFLLEKDGIKKQLDKNKNHYQEKKVYQKFINENKK